MLRVENTPEQMKIYRDGLDVPLLVQNAFADKRPYIHPILAPDGVGVLTEDAPPHHPWQHGLYVGLNDVNGVGFWTETAQDGTFHPEQPGEWNRDKWKLGADQARWTVETEWRDPAGNALLTENQHWTFRDNGDSMHLDLLWELQATVDLRFGKYPYGGLFLRMPYRRETGGIALNSEGQIDGQAEGQRARWVAVTMPIEGRDTPMTVAILDSPQNPEHPTPWRVDGDLGIAPSRCIAGEWSLAKLESAWFAYNIVIQAGEPDRDLIEKTWERMAD